MLQILERASFSSKGLDTNITANGDNISLGEK